jgi:AbiV family abortive infection protein
MSAPVSPQYLLEGAVYALEQCGRLLRDANLLYRNGSYASAVALAAFAREELGRWKLLLALRKKVVGGGQVTAEDIRARCDGHVSKQKAGMLSITMRVNNDTGTGRLLQARMKAVPGSPEWKAADEQLKKLDHQLEKRVPDERHKQRMSALYVDVVSSGEWNRPAQGISQQRAREFLSDAVNDYSVQHSQGYTHLEFVARKDPELHEALVKWSNRPEMLRPEHPPPGDI